MAKDRTEKSIRNIKYALGGQLANLITGFIGRAVFMRMLGAEYLGANGVFTNIISILSLAELGVGTALVFSLYEPLAKNDTRKIKQVMHLYKISYIAVGVIILAAGLCFMPFLDYFIKEELSGTNISLAFMLFVLTSAVSYFYSYKSSLLIADQKRYIVLKYQYGFVMLISILQIIVLILTKDYILYLTVKLALTFIEQFLVFRKADREYPYLKEPAEGKLDGETKDSIVKNIKAMIIHKIATVLVLSTDNLIISRMLGVVVVGIYSNYTLITNPLNTFLDQVFYSLVASVGNLRVTESKEHTMEVFDDVFFMGFWLMSFCATCLICLFNPFISLMFGGEYLFDFPVVLTIVAIFYLTGMRQPVNIFKSAYGLYWQNRYVPIFEIIINLVTSVVLCEYMGVIGVFLGTVISTLTTCFWIEPLVLFKFGFESSMTGYMLRYFRYTAMGIAVGAVCYVLCNAFPYTFLGFLAKGFTCLIFPNVVFVIVFRGKKEYEALKGIVMKKIVRRNIAG